MVGIWQEKQRHLAAFLRTPAVIFLSCCTRFRISFALSPFFFLGWSCKCTPGSRESNTIPQLFVWSSFTDFSFIFMEGYVFLSLRLVLTLLDLPLSFFNLSPSLCLSLSISISPVAFLSSVALPHPLLNFILQ